VALGALTEWIHEIARAIYAVAFIVHVVVPSIALYASLMRCSICGRVRLQVILIDKDDTVIVIVALVTVGGAIYTAKWLRCTMITLALRTHVFLRQ